MYRLALVFAAAIAFVGQVSALSFNFTGQATNITATQLLQVEGSFVDACQSQCSSVNSTIQACQNDQCLCDSKLVTDLTACEQCMFNSLVSQNIAQPDPRVGTNVGIAAYLAVCAANLNTTMPKLALAIPSDWPGATDIILNTGATVVVVGFGAILGGSALLMLANI